VGTYQVRGTSLEDTTVRQYACSIRVGGEKSDGPNVGDKGMVNAASREIQDKDAVIIPYGPGQPDSRPICTKSLADMSDGEAVACTGRHKDGSPAPRTPEDERVVKQKRQAFWSHLEAQEKQLREASAGGAVGTAVGE